MPDTPFNWDSANERGKNLIDAGIGQFPSTTIANTYAFIAACRDRCAYPDYLEPGYWPTLSIQWNGFEVEVCEDHFEFYRFQDQITKIQHFDYKAGALVPEDLISLLPQKTAG